jgi:hypothetical protein
MIRMTPQPDTGEVLAGLVERVTYHNAENGFCVLRARARGHRDVVTVVGHAAVISAGEWIMGFPSTGRDSITATRAGALRRRSQLSMCFLPTANAGQGNNGDIPQTCRSRSVPTAVWVIAGGSTPTTSP